MAYTLEIVDDGTEVNLPPKLEEKVISAEAEEQPEPTETSATSESDPVETDLETLDELTEDSDPDPEPPTHRSKAAEKRIAQLVADRKQLLAMLENQQRLALSQSGNTVPQDTIQSVSVDDQTLPPNPARYDNEVSYLVAVELYKRDMLSRQNSVQSQIDAIYAKHPEHQQYRDEALSLARQGIPTTNDTIESLIAQSDTPAELHWYILSHLDEAAQLAKLPPLKAAKRIALIEQQIKPDPEPITSKRLPPAPINPVRVAKQASKVSQIEAY